MKRRVLHGIAVSTLGALSVACSSDTDNPRVTADPTLEAGGSGGQSDAGGSTTDPEPTLEETLGEPFAPDDRTQRPSAGCGTGNGAPPVGGQQLTTGGVEGRYFITVPRNYDPSVPYPVGFVFHGANNTEITCRSGGNCPGVQMAIEAESIAVYPRSFGTQWTQAERDQNVAYFDDLLAHVKANYCVDERRVYAVGTSSGAHFVNVLACRRGDDLLAVVPGAGERLEKEDCVGRVAALVLHGVADMVSVPFAKGEEARDEYAQQNECSTETVPALGTMHDMVSAARAANMATYGCVDYQGCREGLPVRWCEHSEPGYDGTTHGFPVVGGTLAWDFVRDL